MSFFTWAAIYTVWMWAARWRRFRTFAPPAAGPGDDLVSVVVPMRNEEANAACCLVALRAQTHRRLEVVAVDDVSTDRTPEILAQLKADWPQLRVLRLAGPPPGWGGKTHAMHRGAEAASGEWLLFLDADVELQPETVARALAACQQKDWPAMSVLGGFRADSFWESTLQPWFAVLLLRMKVELEASFCVGAFMFMKRELYRETGGFAAIAATVADDVEMGLLLEDHGVPPRLQFWPEAMLCRDYDSLAEVWAGWSRSIAAATWMKAWRSGLLGLHLFLARVLPIFVVVFAVFFADLGDRRNLALVIAGAAAAGLDWLLYARLAGQLRSPALAAWAKPLGDLVGCGILFGSSIQAPRNRLVFGGRLFRPQPNLGWVAAAPSPPSSSPRFSVLLGGDTARAGRLAEAFPEVEVVVASVASTPGGTSPPNLRLVSSPANASLYARLGAASGAAAGDWIAVLPRAWDGEVAWLRQALRAAAETDAALLVGRVRYAETTAWGRAATLIELALPPTPWVGAALAESCPVVARAPLWRGLVPTDGWREAGGLWLLALLATRRGHRVHEIADPVVAVAGLEPGVAGCWARAARRHAVLWDAAQRAIANAPEPSGTGRMFDRIFPVLASSRLALVAWRGFWRARSPLRTPAVAACLAAQTTVDHLVAWAAVLDRNAFLRRAGERGLTVAPEVDSVGEHPLRRLHMAAFSAMVRDRPVRPRPG